MAYPTADLFSEVLSQGGSNWFDIGIFLGASTADLKEIQQNYAINGLVRCLAELHECLVKKGKPLTWEAIAIALRRLDNHTLADSIHSKYILPTIRRASSNEDSRGVTNVIRESPVYSGTGDRVPECGACRMKEKQIKQLHVNTDALQQKYNNLTAEYEAYKTKKDAAFIELTRENEQLKDEPKFHDIMKSEKGLQDEELNKVPSSVVDVGVQFSWVDVKTEHLQGLTVFRTKYFHVEGEKAHPLIWKGFGFELHLPEHTFLPKEECCIRVDAVIGGDFDIPEGVEPVSAIYVISVTTKLRQPSVLKIQHCVDLDRAHPDSGLSFYRASFKESSPPYRFKRVPGGRFDVLNKYGVLELPVFCIKFIGKDQGGTHSDNSVEGDDSSSSGLGSPMALDTMDDSLMYRGQMFYLYISLNRWQVKFIVVKNIDAFAEYVASELRDHEADALVDIVPCANYIKLEGDPNNVPNGWTVVHHTEPLSISMKRASAFGSEKVVSSPPFCMLTIKGKDTVPDFNEELSYPLTLKECVTIDDHNEPVINIIRTMTKEVESAVVRSKHIEPDSRQLHSGSPHNAQHYMLDVFRNFHGDIRRSINDPMDFSEKLLEMKWITFDVHDSNCETVDKESVRHKLMKCIRARVQDNPQNMLTLVEKVLRPDCTNDTLCQNIMTEMSKL